MSNPYSLLELDNILADPDLFSPLDRHFAFFIGRMAKNHRRAAAAAAALVSRKTGKGNICLDLAEHAGKPLDQVRLNSDTGVYICPAVSDWKEQLLESGVAGGDEGNTPLVLAKGNSLYLRRYRQYENSIISFILQRNCTFLQDLNFTRLGEDLEKLFPARSAGEIDWQLVAAVAVLTRSFTVISGGPGTGKTTTVAKILALLKGQYRNNRQLRILLGAPTGKAATRLQQAIAASGLAEDEAEPLQATTLHRMLGVISNSPYFRHDAANPLMADIIVIDEVSMVDLPLLAKLMQAVPAEARLVLLGDRHQLASVQPGSVLGDICRTEIMTVFSTDFCRLLAGITENAVDLSAPASNAIPFQPLQDSFVELAQNFRFSPESDLARLSLAVRNGDSAAALDILLHASDGSVRWSEIPDPDELGKNLFSAPGVSRFVAMQQSPDPDFCFDLLDKFRILCALRSGPFGMERVNMIIERSLAEKVHHDLGKPHTNVNVPGKYSLAARPIMVTRNDYNLQLFNGDVGITLPDPENENSLRAFFRISNGMLRDVAPALLPDHETVFAMTVHKSQGSEFNRVLLILPDQDSPILTRELLYTAITRAREKVDIWGRKATFAAAVERRIRRTSGLAAALWGENL